MEAYWLALISVVGLEAIFFLGCTRVDFPVVCFGAEDESEASGSSSSSCEQVNMISRVLCIDRGSVQFFLRLSEYAG